PTGKQQQNDQKDFNPRKHNLTPPKQRSLIQRYHVLPQCAIMSPPPHCPHISTAISPFWKCSRFSASSNTTDCGPSSTSSVISTPRYAGRQCITIACGGAAARSCALIWYARNTGNRCAFSASWPIDTQVSV